MCWGRLGFVMLMRGMTGKWEIRERKWAKTEMRTDYLNVSKGKSMSLGIRIVMMKKTHKKSSILYHSKSINTKAKNNPISTTPWTPTRTSSVSTSISTTKPHHSRNNGTKPKSKLPPNNRILPNNQHKLMKNFSIWIYSKSLWLIVRSCSFTGTRVWARQLYWCIFAKNMPRHQARRCISWTVAGEWLTKDLKGCKRTVQTCNTGIVTYWTMYWQYAKVQPWTWTQAASQWTLSPTSWCKNKKP